MLPPDGLIIHRYLRDTPRSNVGGGLPPMAASQPTSMLDFDRVHIRYLGYGHYWFRFYSGSLLKEPKSNQKALAPPLGTSLRLGVPAIRQGFGGPPPRAIHGAGRLNRHPCRFTPKSLSNSGQRGLTGRLRSKARSRSRAARYASWLPSAATQLCRYLWLSGASPLPHFDLRPVRYWRAGCWSVETRPALRSQPLP
ncbi:hypothetical protein SAMN05216475_3892 [Pseudomonas synxantha]|uniref:Threonine synthase n=1 Tax=Pseudomonas synxantha TaxID=47883 RepID=A0AAX3IBX9_9PSED|nr:hypothetical protein SAMN05216475_3892 [Pseudomonas synxantha]VTR03523.1 Uncharacterised protein [Pseudomonas synxantha]